MDCRLDTGALGAIGVSNVQPAHLARLVDVGLTGPAVNQIEVHPYLPQNPLRAINTGY